MQITNCSIFELFYVLKTTALFFWHTAALMLTLGNGFLNILNGITVGSCVNFVYFAGSSLDHARF